MAMVNFIIIILIILNFGPTLKCVDGAINCSNTGGPIPSTPVSESIFDFGDPVMFVTTTSEKFDPYTLVDTHRRTSILEEYLMVGYHKMDGYSGVSERLQMVFYDAVKQIVVKATDVPDLVHQNLEKELYWRYFNSTGIYPSMTIVNTTTRVSLKFHISSESSKSDISFSVVISERDFFKEPQVPQSVVFEIPANARVLRKEITMIQYQSFGLWRWRLSETVNTWSEIVSKSNPYSQNTLVSNFHRIDNPCIRDMFIIYMPRESKASPPEKLVYLGSPLIQSLFDENWFYDMNTKNHPWWPNPPDTIVLTNDHLIVLTAKTMWISTSLNDSTYPNIDLEMAGDVTTRPNLIYKQANPCANYGDSIDCFLPQVMNPQNYTVHRLFYTPVCYLYQFPDYDDYLIFTAERTVENNGLSETDFTVLYSAQPYKDWHILFSNVAFYKKFTEIDQYNVEHTRHIPIEGIVGIFFNHHVRHFDITLKLRSNQPGIPSKHVRFVLPETTTSVDGYGEVLTKEQLAKAGAFGRTRFKQLNGTMGNGFTDFEFASDFQVSNVVVNGETLDVFFIGNQFWIAEAGGPYIYGALRGISPVDDSVCTKPSNASTQTMIKECSFNHPDKIYLCMNEDRRLIIAGKIGSRYTPSVVQIDFIEEFVSAQKVNPWVAKYFCGLVQEKSVFLAGFSGKVLFWYFHEPADEVKASEAEIQLGCTQSDPIPVTCDAINQWKTNNCKVEASGTAGFRLLVIDAVKFVARKQSTDGPLAPFLIDSNTVVMYEGVVPEIQGGPSYDYFSEVFVAQKVFCNNYELKKEDANDIYLEHNCELFVRHIKPVNKYLDGFRLVLYATVVNSIPMLPIPADIVVLVQAQSNEALVKINDYINIYSASQARPFTEDHIGQTLYIPGNFSILLTGFPIQNEYTIMQGYTTMHFQQERRFIFRAFYTFLMDMSTQIYRQVQKTLANETIAKATMRWNMLDNERRVAQAAEIQMRNRIGTRWAKSPFALDAAGNVVPIFMGRLPPVIPRRIEEQDLLTVKAIEKRYIPNAPHPVETIPAPPASDLVFGNVNYEDRLIWYVAEGECHYLLSLVNNPVLKTSGGRISLDLYDRISFEVIMNPLTQLGKILMYRQLLMVTNSNPSVLRVEVVEKLKGSPQFYQFLLSPTGFRKGVAVITVRTRATSLHCPQSSSITLIVLCHRDVGRRLHVNYPIPSCKPAKGMYPRPWYNEVEGCITHAELLDPDTPEIIRYRNNRRLTVYTTLPPNYRPPSYDGTDIPSTRNVYNADPSKPAYKTWYQISRETIDLNRCAGKSSKGQCACSDVDRLLDDEELTECKEKVFFVKRTGTGDPITMSISYDRIMRDEDQNPELFFPKQNWSITIEEINARGEWYIVSDHTPYLKMINSNPELHRGRRYYDMNRFKVTLLGTGLFHFKVKLGNFESFGPVTGYFALYANTDDINHVHLIIILLGTIIVCMTMVLIGFLVNGKRLSSMLPIQPMSHKRKLKLL